MNDELPRQRLESLRASLVARRPALSDVDTDSHTAFGLAELTFVRGDRSCTLSCFDEDTPPDCELYWDGDVMIRVDARDASLLADVLEEWLVEHAVPSRVHARWPAMEPEPVAAYFEAGNPVEGVFVASWDAVEAALGTLSAYFGATILPYVRCLRVAGFDRVLRATLSDWNIVVSRSRRQGVLGRHRPRIEFWYSDGDVRYRLDSTSEFVRDGREPSQRVLSLLAQLASERVE